MQEAVRVGEALTVQVTRAFRTDWTLAIPILFILVIAYFLYKRRGGKNMDFKKIVMAIIFGIIFSFLAFILTGDNLSIAFGLLIIYIELRLGNSPFNERRIKK